MLLTEGVMEHLRALQGRDDQYPHCERGDDFKKHLLESSCEYIESANFRLYRKAFRWRIRCSSAIPPKTRPSRMRHARPWSPAVFLAGWPHATFLREKSGAHRSFTASTNARSFSSSSLPTPIIRLNAAVRSSALSAKKRYWCHFVSKTSCLPMPWSMR